MERLEWPYVEALSSCISDRTPATGRNSTTPTAPAIVWRASSPEPNRDRKAWKDRAAPQSKNSLSDFRIFVFRTEWR